MGKEPKKPPDDDLVIVERLKSAETDREFTEGFVRLDRKYQKRLFSYLRKRLPLGVAEDVYYKAFYKACDKISELSNPVSFKSWFYRIAENETKQWWRENGEVYSAEQPLDQEEWNRIADPNSELEETDRSKEVGVKIESLRAAWYKLNDEEQETLWLTVVFPESGSNILAQQESISPSAIRQRKKRALDKLKKSYFQEVQSRQKNGKGQESSPPEN